MYRLEDNIKNELTEIELEDMDCIRLVYNNDMMWVPAIAAVIFLVLQNAVIILSS